LHKEGSPWRGRVHRSLPNRKIHDKKTDLTSAPTPQKLLLKIKKKAYYSCIGDDPNLLLCLRILLFPTDKNKK
jgi:hypothetical protein